MCICVFLWAFNWSMVSNTDWQLSHEGVFFSWNETMCFLMVNFSQSFLSHMWQANYHEFSSSILILISCWSQVNCVCLWFMLTCFLNTLFWVPTNEHSLQGYILKRYVASKHIKSKEFILVYDLLCTKKKIFITYETMN